MKYKMFGILNILLGFVTFQANLQCMHSRFAGYSYIQDVIDKKENFTVSAEPYDTDILSKFPLSLIISGAEFGYRGQFSSVFQDSDDCVVLKMRHVLYDSKITENIGIRILISIKFIPDKRETYYILNIDKYIYHKLDIDKYVVDKILNAATVLPEKLNVDNPCAELILPVEEVIDNLKEIVAGFTMNS